MTTESALAILERLIFEHELKDQHDVAAVLRAAWARLEEYGVPVLPAPAAKRRDRRRAARSDRAVAE